MAEWQILARIQFNQAAGFSQTGVHMHLTCRLRLATPFGQECLIMSCLVQACKVEKANHGLFGASGDGQSA